MTRFDRHLALFGAEGQERLARTTVAVIGAGGLGSHVVQQLAYMGVGCILPIDPDAISESNLNRLVGAGPRDVGARKVDVSARTVATINDSVDVRPIPCSLFTNDARAAVVEADVVFGCVDLEGVRLALNELCAAFERPYIDLASDVLPADPNPDFGGQVCVAWSGDGCLMCREVLDLEEANLQLAGPTGWEEYRRNYGVDPAFLQGAGPAVVSVNGVVASLGVSEFMAAITGLRRPRPLLTYRGWQGVVTIRDEQPAPCYYCDTVWGKGEAADWDRYIRAGLSEYLPGSSDELAI